MPTFIFLEIIISYVVITKRALCLNKALLWLPVHIVSFDQIDLDNSIHSYYSPKYLILICNNYFKIRPNNSKLQTNYTTSSTTNAI
jgi:hypothetical protein